MELKFENENQAKAYLAKVLSAEGIVTPSEVEAKIAEIVATIPAETRAGYSEIPAIAAAEFFELYSGRDKGEDPNKEKPEVDKSKDKKTAVKLADVVVSDAVKKMVQEKVRGDLQEMKKNLGIIKVVKMLVENPDPSTWLTNVKVIPECTPEKMSEYEKKLVDNEDNKKNFQTIKDAIQKKTPMSVFFDDTNFTLAGLLLAEPQAVDGKSAADTVQYKLDEIPAFLLLKTAGKIPSEGSAVGVEFTKYVAVASKDKTSTAVTTEIAKPRIHIAGKSEAKKGNKFEVINEALKDAKQQPVFKEAPVGIELTFKIIPDPAAKTAKGEVKQRTVRLKGKYNKVPVFTRKEAFSKFGPVKATGVVYAYMDKKEEETFLRNREDFYTRSLKGNLAGVSVEDESFDAFLKTLSEQEKNAGADAAKDFA